MPGALLVAGKSSGEEFSLELYSEEMQLKAFQAVVRYDADWFRLLPSDPAADQGHLLMVFPGYGEVQILGARAGGGAYPGSMLAQLRFMPLAEASTGNFVIEAATVSLSNGTVGQPEKLGAHRAQLLPLEFSLQPNSPNPFNPTTQIAFELPETQTVNITVWNLTGQQVATIHAGELNEGLHSYNFDGSQLSSGAYIYRIVAGPYQATKKMLLMK